MFDKINKCDLYLRLSEKEKDLEEKTRKLLSFAECYDFLDLVYQVLKKFDFFYERDLSIFKSSKTNLFYIRIKPVSNSDFKTLIEELKISNLKLEYKNTEQKLIIRETKL